MSGYFCFCLGSPPPGGSGGSSGLQFVFGDRVFVCRFRPGSGEQYLLNGIMALSAAGITSDGKGTKDEQIRMEQIMRKEEAGNNKNQRLNEENNNGKRTTQE